MSRVMMEKQVGDVTVKLTDTPRWFTVTKKDTNDGKENRVYKGTCRAKAVRLFLEEVDELEAQSTETKEES